MKKRILIPIITAALMMTACGSMASYSVDQLITSSEEIAETDHSTEEFNEGSTEFTEERTDHEETESEIMAETESEIGSEAEEREAETETESESDDSEETKVYTEADLDDLENTEIFLPSAIEHIFIGTINKKGNATGYHYDAIEDSAGEIIEGTKSMPDSNGVYEGKVKVNGIAKSGNKGYSTFYPEDMSPQEVVDAINEAYEAREVLNENLYAGITDDGIEIDMALTDDDKIITAYPVME